MSLFIQASAEEDILRQVAWYAEQGLPHIARRFHTAVMDSLDALVAMPEAGPPRPTSNARLAGLRAWPVRGFGEFWVYYWCIRSGSLWCAFCTASATSEDSLKGRM